jgi:hypothetical protein
MIGIDELDGTLAAASFAVANALTEIEAKEKRRVRVTGLHSIHALGDGQVSIWLDLDPPDAGENEGIVMVECNESEVIGVDRDVIVQVLTELGRVKRGVLTLVK